MRSLNKIEVENFQEYQAQTLGRESERHRILLLTFFDVIRGTYQRRLKCHKVVYFCVQGRRYENVAKYFLISWVKFPAACSGF